MRDILTQCASRTTSQSRLQGPALARSVRVPVDRRANRYRFPLERYVQPFAIGDAQSPQQYTGSVALSSEHVRILLVNPGRAPTEKGHRLLLSVDQFHAQS